MLLELAAEAASVMEKVADKSGELVNKVKSSFSDSSRPLNSNIEKPELKSDSSPERKCQYSDSERPVNKGRMETPQLKDQSAVPEGKYYSTFDERLKQTPREDSDRGKWTGERGNSDFIPNEKEIKDILGKYQKEDITYGDAIPDFSQVSESTVKIDHMTENRADNFRQCDEKCAGQWNEQSRDGKSDWTPRDVADWRKENGYSWHERNDMQTCDLIPTKINDYFGHLGGVSECKKRDANTGGFDFDD